jgi:lysophospholipid acyltransferase
MVGWTIGVYFLAHSIKKCVVPVSVVAFGILSFVHIYRLIYSYLSWKMDYNAIQMMLTARYIFYACDLQDGKAKGRTSLPLYLSYIFMFPNLVVAPIPFTAFANLIERKTNFTHYSCKFALISLGKALLVSLAEILIRPHFDMDWYFSHEWKYQYNLLTKFALMFIITPCARFNYICAFYYTQSALDAMGLTYND